MKAICNKGCQEEFEITDIKIENLSNNIDRHYIECPECHTQYTSYYLDDDSKLIQQEIRVLQKKYPLKIKQKNKLTKLKRKILTKQERLKMEVEQNAADKTD